jgi:hypothetical protein
MLGEAPVATAQTMPIKKVIGLFRLSAILLIVLGCTFNFKAQHINTDSIGVKTVSDNIYNKSLFGDSLTSSFVIVIKKEVKLHKHLQHSEHVVVLEGKGQMTLGTKGFEIKKGDVVFIPQKHNSRSNFNRRCTP